MVVLWQHAENYSAGGVVSTIAGTVGALWLATLIASRISYGIVHKDHELESRYQETYNAASGLLAPAVAPILLVLLSLVGLWDLDTALLASIVLLVLSLFFFSFVSGRRTASSTLSLLLFSALQLGLGLVVVLLKLTLK